MKFQKIINGYVNGDLLSTCDFKQETELAETNLICLTDSELDSLSVAIRILLYSYQNKNQNTIASLLTEIQTAISNKDKYEKFNR